MQMNTISDDTRADSVRKRVPGISTYPIQGTLGRPKQQNNLMFITERDLRERPFYPHLLRSA